MKKKGTSISKAQVRSHQQAEPVQAAWNKIAKGYDRTNTPAHMWLANEGITRVGLKAGMRFLDVACGSGALSIPAARIGAQVSAVDLSAAMVELLQARAYQENLHLETHLMDGHALEFDNDTFDISGSQFGVMLFPDMPGGIREMARVTRPGGRVFLHVYGPPTEIEFFGFFLRAIQAVIPGFTGPPMDPVPLPFQLADPEKLRAELAKAGLKDIRVETITEKLAFQSAKHMWDWLTHSNPIVGMVLAELNLTKQQTTEVKQALEKMLGERSGGNSPAILTNPIHIGIATK